MIRRSLVRLALAAAVAATAVPALAATPVPRAVDGSASYYVSIALPNAESRAAVLLLDESGPKLTATLILEGSPAAQLERVTRAGDRISAEVNTSAGRARLTIQLDDRSGHGELVLVSPAATR